MVGATEGFTSIIKERKEAHSGSGGGGYSRGSATARKSGPDIDPQVIMYGAAGVGLLILVAFLFNRRAARRPLVAAAVGFQEIQHSFKQQATGLGFRVRETRMLRKMALRISPQMPANLLTTPSGREYLIGDVQHRIEQREREVTLLQSLYDKLGRISAQKIHERDSVRVEADLPVWIVQRGQEQRAVPAGADDVADIDPAAGQMLDISEGGAAIAADLGAKRGDTIEFWSADSDVWIPPVMAGVVHVRPAEASSPPVLHLHFLDPPEDELKAAIQELQARSERGYATD
jgi:hypothetical protein